jgi:predicted RNA-binding protein with PIN domain
MPTLIDGYNLLHATGRLTARAGKKALEGARRALLLQVRAGHGPDARDVTVVFDARGAPEGAPNEGEFDGIHIRFARGETADDLIEDMIRAAPRPRFLVVVSDDQRVKRAARRRGCQSLGCLDYYERLQARRPAGTPPPAEPSAKPEASSPEETRRWIDAFAEADDDPHLGEER